MTITEQLQFSVLTAPVATLDRRSLSQAWYSALYGAGSANAPTKQRVVAPQAQVPHAQRALGAEGKAGRSNVPAFSRNGVTHTTAQAEGAQQDRRAPRSALARKIERAFLRLPSASQKASFSIDG